MNTFWKGALFAPIIATAALICGCGGSGSSAPGADTMSSASASAMPGARPGSVIQPNTSWKAFSMRSMPIVVPQNVNHNGDVAGVDAAGHSAIYLANRTLVLLKGAINNNAPDGFGASVYINDLGHVIARSADGHHLAYYSSPTADPILLPPSPSNYPINLPIMMNNNDQVINYGTAPGPSGGQIPLYYASPTSTPKSFGSVYQAVEISDAGLTVGVYKPNTYSKFYYEQSVNGGSGKELAQISSGAVSAGIQISANGYVAYQATNGSTVVISPNNTQKTVYGSGYVANIANNGDFVSQGSHIYSPAKGLFDMMSFLPSNTPWNEVQGWWMNDQGIVVGTARYNTTNCGYIAQLPTGYY